MNIKVDTRPASSRKLHHRPDFNALKARAHGNYIHLFNLWKLNGHTEPEFYVFDASWTGDESETSQKRFNLTKGYGKARQTDIIELCRLVHKLDSLPKAAKLLERQLDELDAAGKLTPIDLAELEKSKANKERARQRNKAFAQKSWNNTSDHIDTAYFTSRNIKLVSPEPNIRSHKHPNGYRIFAALTKVPGSEVEGIGRIDLGRDGRKIEGDAKTQLGIKQGNACWLGDPSETLHIAEGLENALVLRMLGCSFVAAAMDAGNLPQLTIPDDVKEIIIAADPDKDGKKFANKAVETYRTRKRSAFMLLPPKVDLIPDADWNDVLIANGPDDTKSLFQIATKAIRQRAISDNDELTNIIQELNERFFVILNYHGRCVIGEMIEEQDAETKLTTKRLSVQKKGDFYSRYENTEVVIEARKKGRDITQTYAEAWFRSPHRRQYESVAFRPGQEATPDELNLWQGFSCTAKEGDCSKLLSFIKEVACCDDAKLYDYLIRLLAIGVQKPWLRWGVAVVCRGGQGTGKGSLASFYGGLFGSHYRLINKQKHLTGAFNAHLRDAVVLFADEALANDKAAIGTLKSTITEPTLSIEPKGYDVENQPNYLKIIMASNNEHPIDVEPDDRRMFCLEFSDKYKQDKSYFVGLHDFYNRQGGKEFFLHYLQNFDLADFNPYEMPRTKMWKEQRSFSLPVDKQALLYMIEEGIFYGSRNKAGTEYCCTVADIRLHLEDKFPKLRDVSHQKFVKLLERIGGVRIRTNKIRGYAFPELHIVREKWDKAFGKNDDWDDETKWSLGSVTHDGKRTDF